MSTFIYLDGRLSSHPSTTTTKAGFLVFREDPTVRVGRDEEGLLVHKLLNETAPAAERIPALLRPFVQHIRMFREVPSQHGLTPGFYHFGESEAVLENDDGDEDWLGVVIQGKDMAEMDTLFQMLLSGTIQPTSRREVRIRLTANRGSLFSNPPPQPDEPKTGPLGRPKDLSSHFLPPGKLPKPGSG